MTNLLNEYGRLMHLPEVMEAYHMSIKAAWRLMQEAGLVYQEGRPCVLKEKLSALRALKHQ